MNPPANQIGTKDFQTEGFLDNIRVTEYRVSFGTVNPCSGRVVAESPRCHPPGFEFTGIFETTSFGRSFSFA